MQFLANTRYVWYSAHKLRPLANVIRGKDAVEALNWLAIYGTRRSVALKKTLVSALANARDLKNVEPVDLFVKEIRIDQGPVRKYAKPGAQGRGMPQRKQQCHIKVVVESRRKEV